MLKQLKVVARSAAVGSDHIQEVALFNATGVAVDIDSASGAKVTGNVVTSGSAIGTVAKTTTAAEPMVNSTVFLKLTNGNTASSPTVAFNGGAARAIMLGGVAVTGAKLTVAAVGVVPCFFDGTSLHMFGTIA